MKMQTRKRHMIRKNLRNTFIFKLSYLDRSASQPSVNFTAQRDAFEQPTLFSIFSVELTQLSLRTDRFDEWKAKRFMDAQPQVGK